MTKGVPEAAAPIADAANAWRLAAQAEERGDGNAAELLQMAHRSVEPRRVNLLERLLVEDDRWLAYDLRDLVRGSPLEQVINRVLAEPQAKVDDLIDAVSEWYDESMARLSDLYRVTSRQVLFGIGFVVAVAANINAIDLVEDLRANSEARDALVSAFDQGCPIPVRDEDGAGGGNDATTEEATGETDSDTTSATEVDECYEEISDLVTLPVVGDYQPPWTALGLSGGAQVTDDDRPEDRDPSYEVVLGWLLTGFAVSFGAPFWFDVARRLGAFRQSVRSS